MTVQEILQKYKVSKEHVETMYNSNVIKEAYYQIMESGKTDLELRPVEKAVILIRYGIEL